MNPEGLEILSAIAAELARAWNAGDGAAFGAPFAEDADFVTVRGEHFRTRAVIARGHQAIFDSIYKGSSLQFQVAAVRALTPAVLVGHVRGTLQAPSGPMAGTQASLATLVLVERHGAWEIAAFHNLAVAPV